MNEFNEYAISPEIRRALNGLQYTEPTEVQRRVIPAALQKRPRCQIADGQRQNRSFRHSDLRACGMGGKQTAGADFNTDPRACGAD